MSRGRGRGGMSRGRGRGASQSSNRATSDGSQQGEEYKREPLAPLVPTIVVFEKRTPAELQGLKLKLLNTVSASLIKEPKFDSANSIATTITLLVKEIAFYEPEFILKLALYTRDDLGIRSTANYLLSLGSNLKQCQPYIKRYFSPTIKLPSDWLDVAATFQMLPDKILQGNSLPTSLRKAMVEKFPSFDAYQLGKYNKEGSIMRKKRKIKLLMKKNPEKAKELMEAAAAAKPTLTIKRMIRQLHISAPASSVMCILGKKYPPTAEDFAKSGLPGNFEKGRAGKRMKLPVPETWETLLSAKGNKASTWEELIEHKKLPFMAMLRNIRNLIFAGVHPKYHRWVMNKLTNEETIAQSKQFPFRFFSAYEVIPQDLNDFKEKLAATNEEKQQKKKKDGTAVKSGKPKVHITPQHMPEPGLFAKYREALDTAVKHATTHNVKPIRGATVVFCNTSSGMHTQCSTARGLGKFSQSHELGILLGLMCKYVCEECDFRVFGGTTEDGKTNIGVELTEGTILDNMAVVNGYAEKLQGSSTPSTGHWGDPLEEGLGLLESEPQESAPRPPKDEAVQFPFDYLEDLIKQRRKIDNFLVLSHQLIQTGSSEGSSHMTVRNLLHKYRQEVNPDLLFVSVDLSGRGNSILDGNEAHPNDVMITGFSDSILRFIAERGDTNQLQYVEHIDEAKKLPKDTKMAASAATPYLDELDALAETSKVTLYHTPSTHMHERWRTARIFISSTFLDMHGERDLLTRHVIPELRERCRAKRIHISEVDLRWGITEEEANHERQLESCLSEVDRCRPFFVGLLGRRYGYTPKEYKTFSGDPKFDWLKTYPAGRSVTELEMHYGALKDPSTAKHAFFYFRDQSFVSQVPQEHRKIFDSESKEAAAKIDALKQAIRGSSCTYFEGYKCTWAGALDSHGRPMVTGLDELHHRILTDLWGAICKVFPTAAPISDPLEEERQEHQAFAETHTRHFVGRKDIIEKLTRFCDGMTGLSASIPINSSGAAVITGPAGCGKSALLAQFALQYALLSSKKKPGAAALPSLFMLTHHVGSSPDSTDVRKMLYRICAELARRFRLETEVPEDYKELRKAFPNILRQAAFQGRVVLIIDGINQLDPANRALSLDWLPTRSPVKILLSTVDGDVTHTILRRRRPPPPEVVLTPLDPKDRQTLVRLVLAEYHKKLDEKPMNDQMRVLLKKADSVSPLYLILACEELRMFGVFEQLSERIKALSAVLSRLMEEILHRLEIDHGRVLVSTALGCIASARGGLRESELLVLLRRRDHAEDALPRAIWTRFLRAISPFLRPVARKGDIEAPLSFFYHQMHLAVFHKYLESDGGVRVNRLLAEFFMSKGMDYERTVSELPYHLVRARMWSELESLLTDLSFMERKCNLGMSHDLTADYLDACSQSHMGNIRARPRTVFVFRAHANVSRTAEGDGLLAVRGWQQPCAS